MHQRPHPGSPSAVPVSPTAPIPADLHAIDAYLKGKESRVPGIREGCEKTIVWHQGRRQRRDLAMVYLHGFSASPMETRPLCDRLAAAIGANLFYTRLCGHGRDGQAMAAAMPVLMMLNPWDRVINVSLAAARYLTFPGRPKKLVFFRKNKDLGRHVLAGDILSPATTGDVADIIRTFLGRVQTVAARTGASPDSHRGR